MRAAWVGGLCTGRFTLRLTSVYAVGDYKYTDLFTYCHDRQSSRDARFAAPLRCDHLALHGAAPEPRALHAADDAGPRHLGGDLRLLDRAAEHHLGGVAALRRRARRPLRAAPGADRDRADVRGWPAADDRRDVVSG